LNTSFYLLITIGVLAGFFMRPLHLFILGKGIGLVKQVNSKPLAILLFFGSMLSGMGVTIGTIYLCLKLAGFVPLGEYLNTFIVSFIVGGTFWVLYARKFNRACPIDLD
jgi:hypothetical protein